MFGNSRKIYSHIYWGASFFIFNTYICFHFITSIGKCSLNFFFFCLLIMEHQETIWSHMEKSEFPFNSFVWLAILVLYSLLLLPLHIYSVSIQNSNSAQWVHVIQTHGFFMFVCVYMCFHVIFSFHLDYKKKSRLELILDHESTMMMMMIVAAATSLFVLYKVWALFLWFCV